MSDIQLWGILAASLSAVFAGVALILNTLAIKESRKTRELQTFYGIFQDLISLEEKQPEYCKTADGKKAWYSLFFNTLEFFSFLLNEKFLKDLKVFVFFEDTIKAFYEQVFVKHIPDEKQRDAKVYPEFKKLYVKIKEKKLGLFKLNQMKRLLILLLIAFFLVGPGCATLQEKPVSPSFSVYFFPHGGCTEAIVKELGQAKASVLVQAYSFTSAPIAKALLNAHKRGVKVQVILDKSRKKESYTEATLLSNEGVSVRIDASHAIAHNKVMVIDGETVITGSFNFTKAAEEKNAENLLVIHDRKLAEIYTRNFREHEGHSEGYTGGAK